jgi:hypothetical protein
MFTMGELVSARQDASKNFSSHEETKNSNLVCAGGQRVLSQLCVSDFEFCMGAGADQVTRLAMRSMAGLKLPEIVSGQGE